jgi:hypothetical protein
MKIVVKFWQNFKTQPDVWFFYGFLLTFTLSIRKVLLFYPIKGEFNEYTGIYFYLSDIFLILTLIFWLISILCNNNDILSIFRTKFNALYKPYYILPFLLVVWSFISVFWSQNTNLALFRSFKLLEFYFLYIYLISSFSLLKKEKLRKICKIIIILGFIQAIIGIFQFIIQHSIGIFWLRESLISTDLPGVAKIIFNNHKFIRAYGLFPHPNILGGFLVFSLMISLLYKKVLLFCHSERSEFSNEVEACLPASFTESRRVGKESNPIRSLDRARDDNQDSSWNINISKLLALFIIIQLIGLILTFSKSAIIGFTIAMAFILYYRKNYFTSQNKCSLWNIHQKKRGTLLKQAIIIFSIIILVFLLIKPDIYSFFLKSLGEREIYLQAALGMIATHPFIGICSGQFVLEMQKYSRIILEFWQYQPVHNVYLLIWAELGIVGLFLFLAFLWKLFRKEDCHSGLDPESRKLNKEILKPSLLAGRQVQDDNINYLVYFKATLIAFIFIMLFDHYFWDIQQGEILLWLIFSFLIYPKEK